MPKFRVVYPNASKMKYITQAIAKVTDEAPIYVTPEAVEVKVLSPDKSMLTIVRIPATAFEEFEAEGEESFMVASTDLNRVMRRGGRNDVLEMKLDREHGVLEAVFRDRKTGVERVFQVEVLPKTPEPVPELNLELGVVVKMLSEDYRGIVGDAKSIGEEVVLSFEDGKLTVYSSEQQKEYVGVFSEGSPLLYVYATVDKARASYSVDLLSATVKPVSASKQVTVSFDTDKPAKIEYELIGGGQLIYWVVPRVG
ncbi:DNA polymerase sliding clamp subunit B [Desulfurococcus mucosus DSM 2162]|uniref:DNA polymerase sliding clamp n=1 Tax=Desulfurococcus mucosus (strain ATCC 35584 / DSM 2162 / JCM 9187 / O7/1) TaxID=765177 RepID=E8RAP9_DESM0|nr:DNA polymerase sliding clamp subunit B [Desulfurococcus mucosus DSM 2162]